MSDPWAMAAAALFRSPGSFAATYARPDHFPVPTRAIRTAPPQQRVAFGSDAILEASYLFQLPRADVPAPANGDQVAITDPVAGHLTFHIYGQPTLDIEGTTWTCVLEPA